MRILILFFGGLLFVGMLRGQSKYQQECRFPDSIENKISILPPNSRVKIKIKHFERAISKREDVLNCLNWSMYGEKLSDSMSARFFQTKGKALKNMLLYGKALQNFIIADSFARLSNYLSVACNSTNEMGIMYIKLEQHPKAIVAFLEAKQLAGVLNQPVRAAFIDHNIGLLYRNEGRHQEALKKFLEMNSSIEKGDLKLPKKQLSMVYHNIGNTYIDLGNYTQARIYIEKALLIKESLNQLYSECLSRIQYFKVLSKLGFTTKAQAEFTKVTNELSLIDAPLLNESMHVAWGEVLLDLGELEEAKSHFEIALEMAAEHNGFENEKEALNKLAIIYEREGNFKKAYEFFKKQSVIEDSINSIEIATAVQKAENAHHLEIRDLEIQSLRQKQQFQRLTIAGTVALAITILIALFALYSRYLTKVRTNHELTDRNQEVRQQYVLLSQRNREISEINDQLHDKQRQLESQNSIIARRNKELKQANETLEQFSYVASHDLTQPLRTIRSFLGLMEHNSPELTVTSREYLQFAKNGTDKLVTLVRALLAYNRVGRQQAEMDHINLSDTIAQVHLHLASQFEQSKGGMEADPLPEIRGIAAETYLVFQNLVSNALKFRHPERKPQIKVYATQDRDYHYIHVKDNGIGIRPADQQKVFGMLRKLNGDQFEGAGIGLAICQRIVRGIGGEITVQSVYGQGTTFVVQWPRQVKHAIHQPDSKG